MATYSKSKTSQLVKLGLFFALVFIQTWVPFLGNINIPPLSITFVHVTVIVATLWLGTKEGIIVGTFWGLNSWLRSLMMPISPLHQLVLSSPLISVVPRFLMPLIIGTLYYMLSKKHQESRLVQVLFGGLGAILNTILLLGFIGLFKAGDGAAVMGATSSAALWSVLGGIVVANGIPEAIFAGIVTPPILSAIKFTSKKRG